MKQPNLNLTWWDFAAVVVMLLNVISLAVLRDFAGAMGWTMLILWFLVDRMAMADRKILRAELDLMKIISADPMQAAIDSLVGDRLTAVKAADICQRPDGYVPTGVVLTRPGGQACIVNLSAVRWFNGPRDFWNLLFCDSADNVAAFNSARRGERRRCAFEVENMEPDENGRLSVQEIAAALRAGGSV